MILLIIAFDMGWAVGYFWIGITLMLVMIPFAILLEAFILHNVLHDKASFAKCVSDSLIMNLISTVAGCFVTFFLSPYGQAMAIVQLFEPDAVSDHYLSPPKSVLISLYFIALVCYGIPTVFLEAIVLWFLRHEVTLRQILLASYLANLLSYAGLFALTCYAVFRGPQV